MKRQVLAGPRASRAYLAMGQGQGKVLQDGQKGISKHIVGVSRSCRDHEGKA